MSQLTSTEGINITDKGKINLEVEKFYKNLYEKGDTCNVPGQTDVNDFLKHVDTLPLENSNPILAPITIQDLYETLSSCSDSAPGPDGIPYSIIKLTWKHFGPLLTDSWQYSS